MVDISIIVPIYNAQKYIEKCIDSLINQTKKELEFILINDGSTDNTEEIIKKYKDKRIKYFNNENQGIGKTRNFGIDKSKGKYIMFLDSDDYLEKTACEKLYKKITKDDLDIVVCNFYKVKNKNLEKVEIKHFSNTTLDKNKNLLLDINLSPWNKIYKRELIKNNNLKFEEDLKYEDAPFVIESLIKAKKIGHIKNFLNYYVIHENSETTIRDEKVFDIIKIIDIIRNKLGTSYKKELDELTVSMLMNYNIQQRNQKDFEVGKKFIDDSFNYLEKNIPNYKTNNYFRNRNMLKTIIEKNKLLTKIYCNIYNMIIKKI